MQDNKIELKGDILNKLYRYTGFSDMGNSHGLLVSCWIIADETPDVKLFESYCWRWYGGYIEKFTIHNNLLVLDAFIYVSLDDVVLWKDVLNDTKGEVDKDLDWKWNHKWTEYLSSDVYNRLCNCCSRKDDLVYLVGAKWTSMKKEGKDKQGFTKEDALVSILELLDDNGQYCDLTKEEYNELKGE